LGDARGQIRPGAKDAVDDVVGRARVFTARDREPVPLRPRSHPGKDDSTARRCKITLDLAVAAEQTSAEQVTQLIQKLGSNEILEEAARVLVAGR
jgi:hypothetical protein